MEDAPVPSPAPWWRGPLASTLAIAAGALVALVLCQGYAAHQYGTGGVRPGSREYLLAQLANLVGFAVAIFLGTFVAAQVGAALRVREARARRTRLLAALGAELALIPRADAAPAVGGYRDPVRLALPGRLLDSDLLDTGRDRALLAALLGLQAAIARHNDLVLTNAVLLLHGEDDRVQGAIGRYRQELDRAVAAVRGLLPVG
jgi:hypothetical protein